jgi:hypothetical protein
MQGGHLVHAHYYADTTRLPGFVAKISFTTDKRAESDMSIQTSQLWPQTTGTWTEHWCPTADDILFLAGQDWQYLLRHGLETLDNPRLNLIQHVRHGDPAHPLYDYLKHRAIRICVSEEVADAIKNAPQLNGPLIVIPNGCDLPPPKRPREHDRSEAESHSVTIFGYKNQELALALSRQFHNRQVPHKLLDSFVPRQDFLEQISTTDIAICIPRQEEGFYLPALESMNLGCLVVTADCIGNRSFCLHEENCLVADYSAEAFCNTTLKALNLDAAQREQILSAARDTAGAYSLESQRAKYHDLLKNIDQLC